MSEEIKGEPATESYVQKVPDQCDRIVWRNQYIHLPIQGQGKPVAKAGKGIMSDGFTMAVFDARKVPVGTPIYTSAPAIPAGYVLVPVEPTREMIHEGQMSRLCPVSGSESSASIYKAMIAAAPKGEAA